jgi:hypothetical protein
MEAGMQVDEYAARLEISYPEETNKLTTFFRIFVVIPIAIILGLVSGGTSTFDFGNTAFTMGASGGILAIPVALMILFRKRYPKWWFDWNLHLMRFGVRVSAYMFLLQHEYPSTEDEQSVHLDLDYPDAEEDLGRGMPLVKWFLAIPHYFVLFFLFLAVVVLAILSWFSILFTGKYPRGWFDFVVGVMRWSLRVEAYAFILITDKYPPFSLS